MKGRDILLGALLGGILVIWATHQGAQGSSSPHPAHSASAQSSRHPADTRSPITHPATPTMTAHPSSPAHLAGRATSGQAKTPGAGDETIAIASLIAIAVSLSTVTMTVRGRRAAK
jgi:hypothetical protein